jgi:hypothetical protein
VELVNARDGDPRVRAVQKAGYDLDEGMVVLWQDEVFFGDGAVHLLATLSSEEGGLFDRIQRVVFADPRRAAVSIRFSRRGGACSCGWSGGGP